MNFVDFVEKYQQEMAPEQMLAIILPAKYGTQ